MNTVTIVAAYLDRKPMGGSPLANTLRMRGQRCFRPERKDA